MEMKVEVLERDSKLRGERVSELEKRLSEKAEEIENLQN